MRRYKLALVYPNAIDTVLAVTSLNEHLFKDYVEEQSKTSSIRLRQIDYKSSDHAEFDTLVFTKDLRGLFFLGWEEA